MSTPAPTPEPTPAPPLCATDASPAPPASTPVEAAAATGLVSRADIGIREVDTTEALAAAGLRYVRCAAGEVVPQRVGLYLLDVETGAVEGWVLASLEAPAADGNSDGFLETRVSPSPGNRFLTFDRFQHDRTTGLTFEWDEAPLRVWGSQDDDLRMLFRMPHEGGDLFVITDGTLQPVAQFALPDGQEGRLEWLNLQQRSFLVRGVARDDAAQRYLHIFDMGAEADGSAPPLASHAVPGAAQTWADGRYRLSAAPAGFELMVADPDACHVMHYGWDGATLLGVSVPATPLRGRHDCRISPDGRWLTAVTAAMTVSILDTASGDEVYRVTGVEGPGWWLDDSSGVALDTSRGRRIVTLGGEWATEAPRPAAASASPSVARTEVALASAEGSLASAAPEPVRKQPDYSTDYKTRTVTVQSHEGATLASLIFAEAGSPDGQIGGYYSISGSWGDTRDELRVRVWISPFGRCGCGSVGGPVPLAPVIESPPFEHTLQVEVVVDTCLRVREEPSRYGEVLDCLPNGVVLDTDDYTYDYYDYMGWMRVRTADGREGWASADYLRWASDGVELEGEREHYHYGV